MKKILLLILLGIAPLFSAIAFEQTGEASWYGGNFQGRPTANGEIFDTNQLTAAHKELPFGTIVTVVNEANGKSVKVRINDRGPFARDRIIDLSKAAAEILGFDTIGITNVKISADASVIEAMNYCYIQVGTYKNIKNAARLKQNLVDAGLNPYAVMTEDGLVRIEIRNVLKTEASTLVEKLKTIGISSPLIKS